LFLKLKEILKQKNEELAPILAKVKQELEKEREEVITVKPCDHFL
jgi:vacuolar-type H+-ATPase subunit E/Vma4